MRKIFSIRGSSSLILLFFIFIYFIIFLFLILSELFFPLDNIKKGWSIDLADFINRLLERKQEKRLKMILKKYLCLVSVNKSL